MKRQMHLGLFILGTGSHVAGWRHPGAMTSFQDFGQVQEIARIAERGLFDLIFMGDNLYADPGAHPSYTVRLEPMTMLAALAAGTSRIGLGATVSTTYNDPWSVARVFASLDHISNGRAAWNAVTTASGQGADNFGTTHPDHASRYERAAEFVDVVKGLWDCWADDAIVADRASGTYIDAARMRPLDHDGTFFKVKGPINIGRSPQGQPVVLQAGGSEPGQALAARTADVVFSVVQDIDESKAQYAALKKRVAALGRSPDHVTVLPGVMPVVGRTTAEAREKLALLQSYRHRLERAAASVRSAGPGRDALRPRRSPTRPRPARHLARLRPRHAGQGTARGPDPARPLRSRGGGARPLGAVRIGGDGGRHAAAVVRRARGRRLQRHAAVFSRRASTISSISWCRSCRSAACSGARTKARRCATISGCRVRSRGFMGDLAGWMITLAHSGHAPLPLGGEAG